MQHPSTCCCIHIISFCNQLFIYKMWSLQLLLPALDHSSFKSTRRERRVRGLEKKIGRCSRSLHALLFSFSFFLFIILDFCSSSSSPFVSPLRLQPPLVLSALLFTHMFSGALLDSRLLTWNKLSAFFRLEFCENGRMCEWEKKMPKFKLCIRRSLEIRPSTWCECERCQHFVSWCSFNEKCEFSLEAITHNCFGLRLLLQTKNDLSINEREEKLACSIWDLSLSHLSP